MMDCFLYTAERQTLFDLVEHYIPKFPTLSKKTKYELLIFGLRNHDPEFVDLNRKISIAVQTYIFQTKHVMQQTH